MDAQSVAAFEARAAQAEQRLAVLEQKLGERCGSMPAACRILGGWSALEINVLHASSFLRQPVAACSSSSRPPPASSPRALPSTAAAGGSSGGAVDTSRYVAELQALREVLVAAKAEQEALEKRVGEVGACRTSMLSHGEMGLCMGKSQALWCCRFRGVLRASGRMLCTAL